MRRRPRKRMLHRRRKRARNSRHGSRHPVSLHHIAVRLVAETGTIGHRDIAAAHRRRRGRATGTRRASCKTPRQSCRRRAATSDAASPKIPDRNRANAARAARRARRRGSDLQILRDAADLGHRRLRVAHRARIHHLPELIRGAGIFAGGDAEPAVACAPLRASQNPPAARPALPETAALRRGTRARRRSRPRRSSGSSCRPSAGYLRRSLFARQTPAARSSRAA